MPAPAVQRLLPVTLALLITAYGALLRLDAYVAKYGTVEHPAWARVLTHTARAGAALRPFVHGWVTVEQPYVGGDPITYLKYAREMRSFYQAHVREPVFLALTRCYLWLLSNQDAAISFASISGSVLAIFATYLLGAAMTSPAGGLLAALVMAIERQNIDWATDGWRDDVFTAAVVFAAWAFIRIRRDPSMTNAILLGVTSAVACLTRISSLSFVLPGLVWLLIDASSDARRRLLRPLSVALLALVVLVAPYLVNCARQYGDPLYAVNYHTVYYRFGEGMPVQESMSASEYLRGKLRRAPLATIDTALVGILVEPFTAKWNGLGYATRWGMPLLYWSAIAGSLMLPFSAAGRLLLVILLTSLVPYAFTWNVAGGGEWRFTMHTYPFYLVAAAYALTWLVRAIGQVWRQRAWPDWRRFLPGLARAGAMITLAVAAAAAYVVMPWFVSEEVLARSQDLTVGTGARDVVFYRRDWSPPHAEGLVTVRVSLADRAAVWFPLPSRRAYDVTLRFDPVAPSLQHRVSVLLNRQLIADLELSWNPDRVGSYRVRLPENFVRAGANELIIVPDALVPASMAGPRFAWVDPRERLGLRMWYVRVLP